MTGQATLKDRYIVVGVDSSHGSNAALGWALAQARLTGVAVEAVAAWQRSQLCTHHAPCPVIVVPDDDKPRTTP